MSDRYFTLLERHQKLDEALRLARRNRWVDPFEIARIKKLKQIVKNRLAQMFPRKSAEH